MVTLDLQPLPRTRSATIDDSPASSPAESPGASQEMPLLGADGMRRRALSDSSLMAARGAPPPPRRSFRRDVGRAAAETYLLTRLALTLLRYLGVGYRWILQFLALCCYTFLLLPGFLQVAYYYFFSSQVHRSIVYGEQPRNRLDLYLPTSANGPKPVVAFITGGAWIIGYKAWGALLGKRLSENGIVVACIDYRNFPQGTITEMVEDVSQGISYICNKAAMHGGDVNRIFLIGQSAGAHIASCTLLKQSIQEAGEGDCSAWSVSQIKAFFGISGGYNLLNLVEHFHERGLYRWIFHSIMEGDESLRSFSPTLLAADARFTHAISLLPQIILLHGTSDCSIPHYESVSFAETLKQKGVEVNLVLIEGKSHTDLFLQDPLRGGKDQMIEEIVKIIHSDDEDNHDTVVIPAPKRLVPEIMLKLASKISPF